MFKILAFFACVCAVFGLPVDQNAVIGNQYARHPVEIVPIVSSDFENKGDGNFHYGYVSGDGTKVQEEGALRLIDEKTAEEIVHGSYEYVSPEGRNIKVDYYADGTGFHAFSDDIPKSADVSSPAEYTQYAQGRQQVVQNAYNPLVRSSIVAQHPVQYQVGQYQPVVQQPLFVRNVQNVAVHPEVQ